MFPFFPVPMDIAQQAFVQARGEERVRAGNDVTAAETEIAPQLRYDLIWQGGQNHFVALYSPRFIYTSTFERPTVENGRIDPNVVNPESLNTKNPNDTPLSALHNGGVGFEALRPRYRLSAYQFAAVGPITTTALLVQTPWSGFGSPADPQPILPSTIAARFNLLFLQTQIFLPIRVSRRVSITPGFVYNAFGGADSDSRAVIALTSGPGASIQVEVAATRDDRFVSTVGAGRVTTSFQGGREGAIIYRSEATQTWRHWWNKSVTTELLGGASVGGDDINGFAVFTLAQGSLNYDVFGQPRQPPGAAPLAGPDGHGTRLQVGLIGKVQPWVDLFSGELEQRGVGVAAANYTVGRAVFRGQLGFAKVFNTPRSVAQYSTVQGEGSLRFNFTPTVSADAGVRYGVQDFSNAVRFNNITQVTVFAGLAWAPLPAKF